MSEAASLAASALGWKLEDDIKLVIDLEEDGTDVGSSGEPVGSDGIQHDTGA